MSSVGYFGKVPSRGDFVQGNLPASFVDVWDRWLQIGLKRSQEQLGADWLELYLESPVWRFALASGICGPAPVAGVLLPSVDSVDRCFPLTIATVFSGKISPLRLRTCDRWYDEAEQLGRSALEVDLPIFAAHLTRLAPPEISEPVSINNRLFHFDSMAEDAEALWMSLVSTASTAMYGLFWSQGSPWVAPSLLVCIGLPSGDNFAALLNGEWTRWGWEDQKA